nr:c-type cytochrome [Bacteriovorax sp. HI3]
MPQLHDIPLPLPAPVIVLKVMLVFFFLIHILFVEMMVGASVLCSFFQWKGMKSKDKFMDNVAYEIAKSITVNKSMAVVMGVGPLLMINVTYTIFFYSSSSLIGYGWISVIPLVIVAFLLTYLHQYAWEWFEAHKKWHLSVIILATLLFLIIPFFFLTNTNLMWFPTIWDKIHGFFSALFFPNIFARYFFFLFSCLTTTSLFLHWLFKRKMANNEFVPSQKEEGEDLLHYFVKISVFALAGQAIFGVVVVITAPTPGLSSNLIPYLLLTILFFASGYMILFKRFIQKQPLSTQTFNIVCSLLLTSVLFGGILRHTYRENALHPHIENMKRNTEIYEKKVKEAQKKYGIKDYKYE